MKSVLLIDLSGIFWACWHSSADQELSAAYERTLGVVQKIRGAHDYVAVCCDSPPYFRKELLPSYKAQRDAPPPVAIEQLKRVKDRLVADGLLLWECRGLEADDLLASAVEALCPSPPMRGVTMMTGPGGVDSLAVTVASSDKDLLVLVDDSRLVTVLSPMSGNRYDREAVIAKFGVSPDMLGDLLALCGDASDNIPGVPGVGPKTAAKLLLEFGTLEGVLTHTDDIPQPALKQRLLEHGPAARLARKLVTLRTDAPIDVAELFKERAPKPLVETEMDDDSLDAIGPEVDIVDASSPGRLNAALGSESDVAQAMRQNQYAQQQTLTGQGVGDQMIVKRKPEEMATYAGPEFERGLEPASLEAAWRLAGGIFNSRLYTKFTNREAIWSVIVRGREMGLGAMTALDLIHFFEGKPALHAHLIIARAKQHPDCEYFQLVESTAELARYTTKRRGNPEPTNLTYTIEDARRAGVVRERGNWVARPAEMLRKTCGVQLARIEYPEALLGAYSIEELPE